MYEVQSFLRWINGLLRHLPTLYYKETVISVGLGR